MENTEKIVEIIQQTIRDWHSDSEKRPEDYVIVTDDIRRIRPLNQHRDDFYEVVREIAYTNSEMWHEEDKVRSAKDDVVLKAIRNINPLNQHRNDLIEEVDEIIVDRYQK